MPSLDRHAAPMSREYRPAVLQCIVCEVGIRAGEEYIEVDGSVTCSRPCAEFVLHVMEAEDRAQPWNGMGRIHRRVAG